MSTKTLLLVAICAVATPWASNAAVINGDFEAGNLSGWTLAGSGHAATASVGV